MIRTMDITHQSEKNENFTDYHTHILPQIDDGPKDVSVSVNMLLSLKEQGVAKVCLTPHYFHHLESISDFTQRRKTSFDLLCEEIKKQGLTDKVPEMVLGAEVSFERDLINEEDIRGLCYENSDLLLLEMPFGTPDDQLFLSIENLALKFKIRPVIAHLDRYVSFFKKEQLFRLFDVPGVIIQFNASSKGFFRQGSFIKKVIQTGVPVVFGSDCHDMKSRPPKI